MRRPSSRCSSRKPPPRRWCEDWETIKRWSSGGAPRLSACRPSHVAVGATCSLKTLSATRSTVSATCRDRGKRSTQPQPSARRLSGCSGPTTFEPRTRFNWLQPSRLRRAGHRRWRSFRWMGDSTKPRCVRGSDWPRLRRKEFRASGSCDLPSLSVSLKGAMLMLTSSATLTHAMPTASGASIGGNTCGVRWAASS